MKSGLTINGDNAQSILDAIKTLANKDVLVGIPEGESDRDDAPFGNAGIGYVNEYGSPAQNIPPRPHLKPGVKSVESQTIPQLKAAALAVLNGDSAGAEQALERAGTLAADGVKCYMTITGLTPLAAPTLAARKRRGRSGNKPLIDTGQYRRAITHVVRDKNADT